MVKIKQASVDLIIPFYNAIEYIEECVSSILLQTYKNINIIFVDDGSKDETSNVIINMLEQKNMTYTVLFNERRQGVSFSRNKALEFSKGKYVVFIDADDVLSPSHIELLVNMMSDDKKLLAVTNFTKNLSELEGRNLTNIEYSILDKKHILEEVLMYGDIQGFLWNKIFIGEIIRDRHIRFTTNIISSEDLLFTVEYILSDTSNEVICASCDKKTYFYRSTPAAVDFDERNRKKLDSEYYVYKKIEKMCKKFYTNQLVDVERFVNLKLLIVLNYYINKLNNIDNKYIYIYKRLKEKYLKYIFTSNSIPYMVKFSFIYKYFLNTLKIGI